MEGDPVTFQPHEEAEKVARTFERDDSAQRRRH